MESSRFSKAETLSKRTLDIPQKYHARQHSQRAPLKSTFLLLICVMNSVIVREGQPADVPQVMALVRELALYEKAPHEVTNTEARMLQDGFGDQPAFGLFVAELEGAIVGIALYYIRYSTWKGKMLYLEDIVVQEAQRGKGIGAKLFEACLKRCVQQDYAGMTWQVLDWNEPALNFYGKYNCALDGEWVNGKLLLDQIQAMNLT
ncbi:MAG: N-acetyltransferase family protein [Flavobacteriales bacterium]